MSYFKTQSQLDKYIMDRKFPRKSIYYGKTVEQANAIKSNPELVKLEEDKQKLIDAQASLPTYLQDGLQTQIDAIDKEMIDCQRSKEDKITIEIKEFLNNPDISNSEKRQRAYRAINPDEIQVYSNSFNKEVFIGLAQNPNLFKSPEIIEDLLNSKGLQENPDLFIIREELIKNQELNKQQVENILKGNCEKSKIALAKNTSLNDNQYNSIFKKADYFSKKLLLKNKSVDYSIHEKIIKNNTGIYLYEVLDATEIVKPFSKEELMELKKISKKDFGSKSFESVQDKLSQINFNLQNSNEILSQIKNNFNGRAITDWIMNDKITKSMPTSTIKHILKEKMIKRGKVEKYLNDIVIKRENSKEK